MSSLDKVKTEYHRRLIVDVLGTDPDFPLNASILRGALAEFGQDVQVDQMAALAEWLAGAGLVTFVDRDPPVVLRLTDRGRDLAAGKISVSGVMEKPRS